MMPLSRTFELLDADATQAFGRRLGAELFPGAVVALIGPLGAGKTFLTRAIAEGLGIRDSGVVSSPTYVLIQEYDARVPIFHFDAYRLGHADEFADLGAHEYLEGGGVCLIEWADRVAPFLPVERLTLTLEVSGATSRRLTGRAMGAAYERILKTL
jgi:tRNA threonylcarbamoyladenosine biosynthesis protein TsaE